jgi:ferric-dicitrate binding protein FerR (iron transport regulator)
LFFYVIGVKKIKMDRFEDISVSLLYRKSTGESLPEKEQREFDIWYRESEEHRLYYSRFCAQQEKIEIRECSSVNVQERLIGLKLRVRAKHRLRWYRWSGVAAAVLIVSIVGWLFLPGQDTSDVSIFTQSKPGKAAVVLQLGHGEQIVLDSTCMMRAIGKDGAGMRVRAGILEYDSSTVTQKEIVYNELRVPPSGEYAVVLADGTKIYLNSASTLRYPVVFPDNERRVELSGEAYFVVSAGMRPFVVETKTEEVKVFGTEFNVMAYADEEVSQTTLVKGSVGVLVKGSDSGRFQKIVPSEQFVLNQRTKETTIIKIDVFSQVAWKEGLFVSRNDDLGSILRKLARWYEVEFVYLDPGLREKRFFGIMKRQASLQKVLEVIAEAGDVQFNVNGRTVTVSEGK